MLSIPPNYPEEYTSGSVQFFGREYQITPDVLIPRLETECLVRRARQIIQKQNIKTIIDIGCGSGIIGTSVADIANEVIFLDISPEVLTLTEKNFRTHYPDKKAQFIVSDLLSCFTGSLITDHGSLLFLTNLPYIRDADWKNMSADTIHEPKIALFGGEQTGFELYEKLFEQFSHLYQSATLQSYHPTILFEFGFDQREHAENILQQYPNWEYSFFADYAAIERFGEVRL